MNAEQSRTYEQLSLDAAARVDAVCDGFEKAWKATRSGAEAPHLSSFLDGCDEPERTILAGELRVLDRACRQRYGLPTRIENGNEPDATRSRHRRTDSTVTWPADWPHIPGLELVEVLGQGGMGVVYKARQETLERDVAVKFLRDAHQADSERRERFVLEARAVARLRHPNLVQVYEFGELPADCGVTSQPYLVLEYVAGGSLADLLRGSPQSPREAARLVETLADAIHYAHQQGVIHRDLKPANVLLAMQNAECRMQNGREVGFSFCILHSAFCIPKITDFGLAKFLAGSDLTHSGYVLGTPSYMAPEQAAGQSANLTAAVDVYGLGAILYEALTGRPPFAAATVDATLGLVRQDEPVPPRRLQPTVPRDLETICLKCLRKEAGRRYASAQDLADDLRRFQAGEPVRARPIGMGERVVGWCRRKPGVAGLAAALVLVFLAGCLGVLWQWRLASRHAADYLRERDVARVEKERAQRHLQMIRIRVDELNRRGNRLLHQKGQYRAGQAVLEEALLLYQELLPEEGNDPQARQKAANMFRQMADTHLTLGHAEESAKARARQASLLVELLAEQPDNKRLRLELADSHRWRGNAFRDLDKTREARAAYDQAAELHEGLLRDFPDNAGYKVALANTLLNLATLLSRRDQADELEALYRHILELNRAAVRAAPTNAQFHSELAIGLEDQGMFFLETGQIAQADAAIREALAIHQKLITNGKMKGYIERFAARSHASLGSVLAAAGRIQEAEASYQQAVDLLEPLLERFPDSAFCRIDLARTLAGQARLRKELGRPRDAEPLCRRVIHQYETLTTGFAKDSLYQRNLVQSYLELVTLLWELGRPSEAAEPYRKAFAVDAKDADINNNRAWFLATAPEPRLRDAARAVHLAQKIVSAHPKDGVYHNTLGVAHYRNGDDKSAIAELETSMRLRAGGDCNDWFFLALAHARLGHRDQARLWNDRALAWMDKYKPHDDELRRFRAEAAAVLAETPKH